MIGSLKKLGLMLLALGTLSAMNAAGAAAEFEFHSDGVTTLESEGSSNVWTSDLGESKCNSVSYHGEMDESTEEEIELESSTEECSWALGLIVEDWNGCIYRFVPWKKTGGGFYDTTDYFECPVGKTYTKTFFAFGVLQCSQHVGSQFLGVTQWNGLAVWNRSWKALTYQQTAGGGFFACSTGETSNGEYTDEGDLDGKNGEGEETEFWLE